MHKLVIPFLLIFFTCDSNHKNGNWIKTFGGSSLTEIVTQSIDKEGNIIVGGTYTGEETQFGNTTLSLNGSMNAFLLKFDSFGDQIWSVKFGQNGIVSIQDIDTDEQGNIYALLELSKSPLTGEEGEINFNNSTIKGNGRTPFIVKISKIGKIEWVQELSNYNYAKFNIVKVWNENLYVGGGSDRVDEFISKLSDSGPNFLSGKAIFLKLDLNAKIQKNYILDGNYLGEITDMEISIDGKIYLSGNVYCLEKLTFPFDHDECLGNIAIDGKQLIFKGYSNGFIAKIENDKFFDLKLIGNDEYTSHTTRGITFDKNSNLYITGSYKGKIQLGNIILNSDKNESHRIKNNTIYFTKLDSSFNYVWGLTTKGGSGSDYIWDLLVNENNQLVVAGDYFEQVNFGEFSLGKVTEEVGKRGMFIAVIDSNGNYQRVISDNSEYGSRAINVDTLNDGSFIISGGVDGKSNLNGIKFGLNKGRNAFVSKISLFD